MVARIQFSLLGSVRAWRDQVELDLGCPKQRAVFAALALSEGAHVTPRQLVDAVWGDDPPPTAPIRAYASAVKMLDEGLALWKGTPLAGVPGPYAETQR